jgi:GntR family transcriptional regulator of vanillate catabolism
MAEATRFKELTEQIKQAILRGVYPPGAHLSEYALAETFAASRTPVRNALANLHLEDLVEYRQHRGYTVRVMSHPVIQARLRVRAAMEGLAARILAAQGIAAPQRLQLKGAHAECQEIAARHPVPRGAEMERYLVAVDRFYQCLRESTGNRLLIETIERSRLFPIRTPEGPRWVEHESFVTRRIPALIIPNANLDRARILDAIDEGNGVRAETLLREHMFAISQGLVKLSRQIEGEASDVE